jgi:hypothetical protein
MKTSTSNYNFDEQVKNYIEQINNGTFKFERHIVLVNRKMEILYGEDFFEALKATNNPILFMRIE